jgi:hypothetical protein
MPAYFALASLRVQCYEPAPATCFGVVNSASILC